MVKTVFKEIGIVILLLIAVILVLAIIFYDYIPSNKTVPIKIQAYDIPEDIHLELQEAIPEEQNIVRTYSIDSTDLDLYESTNDYDKGKANPFAYYKTQEEISSNNNTENNNTTNTTQNNTADTNKENNTSNEVQDNQQQENEVYITTPGKNY